MPYVLSAEMSAAVGKEFSPELPSRDEARIARGSQLTDAEKNAIPRLLIVKKPRQNFFPDILGWLGGPWIVSQRVREQIDMLEPGTHEFIPLEVKQNDGRKDYGTYYLLLLTQAIDAIVYDETQFAEGFGWDAGKASRFFLFAFDPKSPCTLYANKIQGKHLWRGVNGMETTCFCSDELGQYLIENRIRGWSMKKCTEKYLT